MIEKNYLELTMEQKFAVEGFKQTINNLSTSDLVKLKPLIVEMFSQQFAMRNTAKILTGKEQNSLSNTEFMSLNTMSLSDLVERVIYYLEKDALITSPREAKKSLEKHFQSEPQFLVKTEINL